MNDTTLNHSTINHSTNSDTPAHANVITRLEAKINQLIVYATNLKTHNDKLSAQHQLLCTERVALLQQNNLAKNKIAAMIDRLKALEHNQ